MTDSLDNSTRVCRADEESNIGLLRFWLKLVLQMTFQHLHDFFVRRLRCDLRAGLG
jgi:hypothetical protein